MGSKSKAPDADPRIGEAALKQADIGQDMVDFLKQSWASNQPRLEAQDALNQKVTDQQMRLSQSAEDRANDAYSFYKDQGRPVIQQTLNEAKDWDSQDNIDKVRGQASADVQSSMDKQQQAQTRTLTRLGINPNSSKFAALNQQMGNQTALAQASGMNQAGEQRKVQAVQMRQQAGNLASGMPAQSMGFSGQAGAMGSSAAGVGAAGIATNMAAQNQYTSGMAGASQQFGAASSNLNNLYSNQLSAANMNMQQEQSSMSGLGALAGMGMMMMADGGGVPNGGGHGGRIRGPGNGISDDVPAVNDNTGQRIQLSNGEYIIPADVVRKVGEDKFDSLIKKYHTPAAQQRARARGNLGRRDVTDVTPKRYS
jgi:hypothetical protein